MPSKEPEAFVERLIEEILAERRRQGLSHEKLAAASGVDRAAISRFESGQRVLGVVNLYKLANGLGLELSTIVKRAERASR